MVYSAARRIDADLDRTGWYYGNSGSQKREVVEKEANAWGLYDMSGNVWECCWDWYSSIYSGLPDPDSDPMGTSSGSSRVIRGAWHIPARYRLSADRGGGHPGDRGCHCGFRLNRSSN